MNGDKEFEIRRKLYVKNLKKGDKRINRRIYDGILWDDVKEKLLWLEWVNFRWEEFSEEDKMKVKMFGEMMNEMFKNR